MKRIGVQIIWISLIWLSAASGQNTNPFEILERMENNGVLADSSVIKEEAGLEANTAVDEAVLNVDIDSSKILDRSNPFDIYPKEKTQRKKVEVRSIEQSPIEENQQSIKSTQFKGDGRNNFLFWVILISFLILAVILSIDRWYITRLFKSVLNYNLANSVMRENNGTNLIKMILLYALFFLSAGIFVYLGIRHFSGQSGRNLLFLSIGVVFAIYFVRHSGLRFLYLIFPRIQEMKQFSFSIASFNIVLGIILLVPSLLVAFGPDSISTASFYLGLLIVLIMYLLRSFRGLLIAMNYVVSIPFHFFLYLCAFEIIPLMVIYKLIADFV